MPDRTESDSTESGSGQVAAGGQVVGGDEIGGPGGPGAAADPGSHGPGGDEVAELVWRIGEDVEGAVRYVVDGREYIAGTGTPERTVELSESELRAEVARIDEDRDDSR